MAAPTPTNPAISPDTLITIKVSVNDSLKKLKLPLKDLGATVLPDKLRHLLAIKPEQTVTFERFSDSAGGYITLDPNNPQVFKTLIRAAKAKLKLRLKATVTPLPEKENQEDPKMAAEATPQSTAEPVIVRSPVYQVTPRGSTAFDRRSVGSGIFEFREARASQQTLVDTSEAPVPRPFSTDSKVDLTDKAPQREMAIRNREPAVVTTNGHPWSVYCNECDVAMIDAHFHCSICDGGDYDLCEACVAAGKLCPGEGHWLIKRFIKEGKVINSTTERISPRKAEPQVEKEMPGAFTEDTKTLAEEPRVATRTCNSCVVVLPERDFVTCTSCEDFDLCIKCHTSNKHGHHPAHGFKPATEDTVLPLAAESLLAPGRSVRHNAICDGCDKKIIGVRHKCLNCPDWDYCSECVKNARTSHPRHRFAAIYTPIANPNEPAIRHFGIYCDGPLCSGKPDQSYITGNRFKCAVCHDTDFCASCEALPQNPHNRTHPLIKFKTPVRNVSITTENEDLRGNTRLMGDRRTEAVQTETKSASTETTPVQQANAATQVQTLAEIKPTEEKIPAAPVPRKIEEFKRSPSSSSNTKAVIPPTLLQAHFVQDSVPDGKIVQPGERITQVWTMRNPGPHAWPAGCSVRFIGGDNMLDVDNTRPASVSDIANATESNVVGREVKAGENVAFKVTLKAPMREGKSISYWRMKSADGTPFGHRLWCEVDVKKPVVEASAPEVKIAPMPPAPQYNVPFDNAQQAQLSRMQAIRQQQMQLMQHQQMLAQQPNMPPMGQPPAYDARENPNISARIAMMREQQAKRREHMMAQFNAQREMQHPIPPPTMSGGSAYNVTPGVKPPPAMFGGPPFPAAPTMDEQARREATRNRVEHIKAKILRAREEKARAEELAQKEKEKAKVGTEKIREIVEQVKKNIDEAGEQKVEDVEGSQMVFPKLEKESPSSSTYESATSSSANSTAGKGKAAYVENEAGEVERSAAGSPIPPITLPEVTSPAIEEDFEDLDDDDLEVLSAGGDEESEDDGFVTDEEYDILDASDEETVKSSK